MWLGKIYLVAKKANFNKNCKAFQEVNCKNKKLQDFMLL